MKKLLRHLAYLSILVGLLALREWLIPNYGALTSGWDFVEPVPIPRMPTPAVYWLQYVVWLATPLVVGIAVWVAVRLLHRKQPCEVNVQADKRITQERT